MIFDVFSMKILIFDYFSMKFDDFDESRPLRGDAPGARELACVAALPRQEPLRLAALLRRVTAVGQERGCFCANLLHGAAHLWAY